MDLLLHCCCGPCANGSIPQLTAAGYELFCWFWNPNIHPYQEHKHRRQSFVELMEHLSLPYQASKDYPLETWLKSVAEEPEKRCLYCYETRIAAAAQKTAEMGIKAFSTTLLVSPYQNREIICKLGNQYAQQYGISFVDMDLRPGFREGNERSRQMGLYMQKYCGCIYSEKDRYVRPKRKGEIAKDDHKQNNS